MGFNSGDVSQRKVYTGLAKMDVVALNPTKTQLEALGIKYDNEPVYGGERTDGTKYTRLDFWLQLQEKGLLVPVRFFVSKKKNISQNNNMQFIDDFGISTYAENLEVLKNRENIAKWFDLNSAHQAWEGEAALVDFIRNWLCISRETVAKIDDFEQIFAGDVKELAPLIGTKQSTGKPYKVQVLLTVNDRGYQDVYDRFFGRMDSLNTGRWSKQFEGSQSKVNYGGSFNFKEYDGAVEPDSFKAEPATEVKEAWS